MSSAAIMVTIRIKEFEIEECKLIITELEIKLEQQKLAAEKFESHAQEFDNKISEKRRRVDGIGECTSISTLADKYTTKMDEVFNSSTWNSTQNEMLSISANIASEISQNEADLDNERARLICLQNELSDLNVQYQTALKREQEEAAAAAAMVAVASNATTARIGTATTTVKKK